MGTSQSPQRPIVPEKRKNMVDREPTSFEFHAKKAEVIAAIVSGTSNGCVGTASSSEGSGAPAVGVCGCVSRDGLCADWDLH